MKHRILLVVIALILSGCAVEQRQFTDVDPENIEQFSITSSVRTWHDDKNSVTCWIYTGYNAGGIHCIPDKEIE